jgi:hypothetical protein
MSVNIAVKQPKIFKVDGVDFRVEFPVSSVIKLEDALGRSMKSASDWLKTQTKELPEILKAGLLKHHKTEAEKVATAICDSLDPEEIEHVIDGLCVAACPKAMARIEAEINRLREKAAKGLPLPNVPSVGTAV